MKTKLFFAFALVLCLLTSIDANAQLVINIRYTGENGAARKYVEEMEKSGIADRIRAIEGCIGYEYFFPANDPEGVLLIDTWEDQAALNRYHSSPAMTEASALREKYNLGNRQIRMFNPVTPGGAGGQGGAPGRQGAPQQPQQQPRR
ncbi:MAG: antibiotic biosynthesis monooxygenase [Bacteroidaceae bacterium]|nr:antibiotic biosynthesis monooxygenase [Bacteroidaceae bacterium]